MLAVPDDSVNNMAPVAPINTPVVLLILIGERIIKKDKITTMIGFKVMMMPELMDDDKLSPLKKNSWLMVTPNIPQIANKNMSFRRTFSFIRINLISQKSNVAPTARNIIKTLGVR